MADASGNTTISNSQGKKFWKKVSDDPSSGVTVVKEKLHLVIPPYYLEELKKSVTEVINCRLIRYQKELGGILAGYGNLIINSPKADLLFDLSNIHVDVEGDFYIFNPEVNNELTGIVNRTSSDYIGCLVHGLFNISLPKPFGVNSENWSGKPARLLDQVRFSITRVDLRSVVPYIEGKIIELIPNAESDSEVRKRTSSDSGVSIASEESMNIAITPEANMDRKKSKLSLSQKKKESITVADEVKKEAREEDKKRKRNISEGSSTQETPKNKRAKTSIKTSEPVSEDLAPVENLATNLFTKFSEKLGDSPTPSRKQKKKLDTSTSDQASIATEKNLRPNMVTVPEDLSQRLIKELSSSKKASKKRKMEEESDSKESVKSPEKNISKQNVDDESERGNSSDEDFKSSKKIPSSQKKSKLSKKMDVVSEKESSVVQVFKSPPKTPSQSKLAKKLNVESEKESSCSDQDFVISQKTPVSLKKSKLTKKSNVESEKASSSNQDFMSSQKTPVSLKKSKLTKQSDVESEKESSCSDKDFMISQKTPISLKKSKLTKKSDVDSEKESSGSDQDFMISQKTPVSLKKSVLSKRLDVKFEKASSSDDFESSPKVPLSQNKSKLIKSNELEQLFVTTPAKKIPAKETPAKKTPSIPVKEEASLKKSKNSDEANDAVTPGKQSNKKTAVVDSDPESDTEFLIQELLNSSRLVASSNSTPSAKTSKKKQTPVSKIKQTNAEKKSKTLNSPSVSSQVEETETATLIKRNVKESLSRKSPKALAFGEKQETATGQKALSPKKTPNTAHPERASNVPSKVKKIEVEPAKKRTKLKKNADKEANSDHEDILSEILKTVQPKEKKSKTKTNTANS